LFSFRYPPLATPAFPSPRQCARCRYTLRGCCPAVWCLRALHCVYTPDWIVSSCVN
jgi:hypothetical protein